MYFVHRMGTAADNVGAQFFFYCETCENPVCIECMTIRRETQDTLTAPEYRDILCPVCGYNVLPVRMDHKSYWEAAQLFTDFNRFGGKSIDEGKLLLPYDGWHTNLLIYPGNPGWVSFAAQRHLEPGEAFELTFNSGGKEYRLRHYKYPQPYCKLFDGDTDIYIGRYTIHDGGTFGLSADYDGVLITNKGKENLSWVKTGIVASRGLEHLPHMKPPEAEEDSPKKAMFRVKLKELTDKRIWDYMSTHSDKQREKGEFHIAGSTDLIYYNLVEMYFKKVIYTNFPQYFHHPVFELAPPVIEKQIRDLTGCEDPDVYIFRLVDDAGAAGEMHYFICAEYLFVEYVG